MSYVERQIDLTIQLGGGTFDGANDTVTLTGLRVVAQIAGAGGDSLSILNCRVYGLPLTMMNQLTRIGQINAINPVNSIQVAAGDKGKALSTAFKGVIIQAWADFQAAPDVALNISAWPSADASVRPVAASSFIGPTDVAEIMRGFATLMGLAFENHGVNVTLSNPYFPGTALTQVQLCARAADINYTIELGVLAIWPKNGARNGNIPLISAETGMVGYPVYSSMGITATSEYLPDVRLGGQVQVKSTLTPACGLWNVFSLIHDLESERPGGAWFTRVTGYPFSS